MLQATVQNRVTVGDRTYYGTTREKFITQTCQWHISRVLSLQPQQQVRARIRMNESRIRQQIFAIEFLYNILMFVQHPDAAAVCFYMRAGVASNDIVGLLMVCSILATHHVYGRLIGLDVLYVQTPPTIFLFVNKDRRIFCTSSASRVVTRHMHHEAISIEHKTLFNLLGGGSHHLRFCCCVYYTRSSFSPCCCRGYAAGLP